MAIQRSTRNESGKFEFLDAEKEYVVREIRSKYKTCDAWAISDGHLKKDSRGRISVVQYEPAVNLKFGTARVINTNIPYHYYSLLWYESYNVIKREKREAIDQSYEQLARGVDKSI